MEPIILIAGFGAFILIISSILLLRRADDDPLSARIDEYAAREEPVSMEEIELSLSISDRIFVPIVRRLSRLVIRFTPQSMLENTAHQLELAGSPRNMTAAEFWIIRGAVCIGLGVLFFVVLGQYGQAPGRRILYTAIVAGFGFFLPTMFLSSMIRRRQEAIVKKFPDALDLMSICVDAGLTFDGAMAKVDEKWDGALARDMSDRMEVPDVTSFVAAILQADQLGVSIGKVLRIQSEQMRIRRRQRAEEKAHQAPVKMLFPMVFLIFPSMFIVLLGPAGFQVLRSTALGSVTG